MSKEIEILKLLGTLKEKSEEFGKSIIEKNEKLANAEGVQVEMQYNLQKLYKIEAKLAEKFEGSGSLGD